MATRFDEPVASTAKRSFAIPKRLLLLIQVSKPSQKIKPQLATTSKHFRSSDMEEAG